MEDLYKKLEFERLINIFEDSYNKNLSIYDSAFLIKSIEQRQSTIGITNTSEYIEYISKNSFEGNVFLASLNNTHSEFFRNSINFALIEQWIIPRLIESKTENTEIRIWSAACSTGQEPYSIAMILDKISQATSKKIRFRIFATDISQDALGIANQGAYSFEAIKDIKLKYIEDYFTKIDNSYFISPKLRENITFSKYDLLEITSYHPPESIYGDFDIVLCCNLLFYYQEEIRNMIVQKVQHSMADKGYFVTGEAEKSIISKASGLYQIAPPAAIFQNDRNRGAL